MQKLDDAVQGLLKQGARGLVLTCAPTVADGSSKRA